MQNKSDIILVEDPVVIGRFGRTFGIRGEIRVQSDASNPERWLQLEKIFTAPRGSSDYVAYEIENVEIEVYNIKLKLIGVSTIEEAKLLTGSEIVIPASERAELEEDEFYIDDILGFEVKSNEAYVGKLTDVMQQGHHDLWIVKEGDTEYMIPAVSEYVDSVCIEDKLIRVKQIEGLRSPA